MGLSGLTLGTCTNCRIATVTTPPVGSILIATWTMTVSGTWDLTGGINYRAVLGNNYVVPGTGLVSSNVNGLQSLALATPSAGLFELGGSTGFISLAASSTYYTWVGANTSNNLGSPYAASQILTSGCTASHLYVTNTGAVPSGGSIVATLYDGVAGTTTTLTVTFPASTGSNTVESDVTHTVATVVGHWYSMQLVTGALGSSYNGAIIWGMQCQ